VMAQMLPFFGGKKRATRKNNNTYQEDIIMKKVIAVFAMVAMLTGVMTGVAAASLFAPSTTDELTKTWGNPKHVKNLKDGSQAYVYSQSGPFDASTRVFIVKDGQVKDNGCVIPQ
jgi:Neuraminidase (sialidase)